MAAEVLAHHDVGRGLRPEVGDLDSALLEDHLAALVVDQRVAAFPPDRVVGMHARLGEEPAHFETRSSGHGPRLRPSCQSCLVSRSPDEKWGQWVPPFPRALPGCERRWSPGSERRWSARKHRFPPANSFFGLVHGTPRFPRSQGGLHHIWCGRRAVTPISCECSNARKARHRDSATAQRACAHAVILAAP